MRVSGGRNVSFGLSLYTGQRHGGGPHYGDLAALALEAEDSGFDTFWVSEHHDFDDGYLPSPLVALAAAAQATNRITLATGLVLGPLSHPLRLAEDAVVLDHLSGGRLLLGLGIGYASGEYDMFGVPMAGRGQRLSETVEILRRAWTGERFSFHGDLYSLEDVRVTPKALRPGGIPIWLGGYAKSAVLRAGRLADGHLVGRGATDLVASARRHLDTVRDPSDASFTLAVNLALVGSDPAAGGPSARSAFARQQQSYEAVQAGTDVYANQLSVSGGDRLDLGAIDAYAQLQGDAEHIIAAVHEFLEVNRNWASVHVALRALFPDEELDVLRRRIAYLGEAVLPALRLCADEPEPQSDTGPHRQRR